MLRPWKLTISERIGAADDAPIYLQIVHALIHEIERGRLAPGAFLPSSRQLADDLGVNRKTVVLAYDEMVAQGWLESLGTRGTVVALNLPRGAPARETPEPSDFKAAYPIVGAPPPAFVDSPADHIRLDEGSPDCRLFPGDALSRAYRTAVRRMGRGNDFRYGDPRGSPRLREQLAAMLSTQRGLPVTPDHVCVTRGSQMAIAAAARILLKPGDVVLMEDLSYTPAGHAFRAAGAEVAAVPLDAQGIDVDAVGRLCRAGRVRALFLTPHHQFPTTVALRPERRLRLVDLARRHAFAIIEDDYDHEHHFASQPLLPIASYAPDVTLYLGSLSKVTLPTLRIGYAAAPPEVIAALAGAVMTMDRQGNRATEDAVADLIADGEIRRHLRKAHLVYDQRRKAFAASLHRHLGDMARFEVPDGGLAFWLSFDDPAHLDRIDANAAAAGLRLTPSTYFATPPSDRRGLRLGFAGLNEGEAEEALKRLRQAAAS